MNITDLQKLDLHLNWHPCSQMKDYELFKPLVIEKAYDCYFELSDGKKIIDAISSWWCKSLGHQHPQLKNALLKQIEKFEHVIFANTTNETIIQLSKKLTQLSHLDKVFYVGGDGSSAVETALKMSIHARKILGHKNRNQFIAFKNGYHGETIGALSVSDCGLYRKPYEKLLFDPIFIEPLYVSGINDKNWNNASDHWNVIEKILTPHQDTATAIIFEPIVQAASGMKIYSQDFLSRICSWARENNIHIIADEIMTGIARCGKMLASEYANIQPDFVCLSKGLASGWVPLSLVLTTDAIYELFYDDYESGKSFLHSHTYSGNAIGAALALETLNIIEKNNYCDRAIELQTIMRMSMHKIAQKTGLIKNIRGIGAIIAADLVVGNSKDRIGFRFYQEAIRLGAFIRPLGNTIYWLPPLTISNEVLESLEEMTIQAILAASDVTNIG